MKENLTKYIAIVVVMGVLIGIALALYLINKPASRIVTGDADYKLNANKLYDEFDTNEEQANNKYLNKVLSVQGRITELDEPDSLGFTITLESDGMFGVSCEIADPKEYSNLKVGDVIIVKGLCTGKLMDVVLVNCMINEKLKNIENL